jgi:7-carboxy-7-deazaguanine synthase
MIDHPPNLVVSEIFGPTIQGEGPSQGRRAAFVRLGHCNLTCSWCDTAYTWDWAGRNGTAHDPHVELRRESVLEVLDQIALMRASLVVITGGEPLLQRTALTKLVERLDEDGISVEIETNGSQQPLESQSVRYNVSPKLTGSGVAPGKALQPDALRAYARNPGASFKFVIIDVAELDEVEQIARTYDIRSSRIWIMPEGRDLATVLERGRELAPLAVSHGWNFTTRLHILLWGDARGR